MRSHQSFQCTHASDTKLSIVPDQSVRRRKHSAESTTESAVNMPKTFDPDTEIPDLRMKVIVITGGRCTLSMR